MKRSPLNQISAGSRSGTVLPSSSTSASSTGIGIPPRLRRKIRDSTPDESANATESTAWSSWAVE